jgi:hypothetical protein
MKRNLIETLKKGNLQFNIEFDTQRIVAQVPNKGVLTYDDYSEENLREIVKNNKTCYVDLEFWNYNYCTFKNLNPVHISDFLENVDFIITKKESFSEGTVVMLILLNELLFSVYKIEDQDEFEKYLEKLKISKKIIKNFLINVEYQLPLTKNYLHLILKVFDEETIYDFIFRECCYFTIEECKAILNHYPIKNIHLASYYVVTNFESTELILKYLCFIIESFDGIIDYGDIVYYNKKNKDPLLGYYLLTLPLDEKLEPRYYYTMKNYMAKSGSLCVKVVGDIKEDNRIEERRNQIINYFDKY